jgi:hypothetical protein
MSKNTSTEIGPVTNGGEEAIMACAPYTVTAEVVGDSDILFHRWNCEAVETKGNAAKGSKAKKSDDVESYVYRDENNTIGIPGEYFRQSVIHAAKFKQDPRSPRKSACDLVKAAVVALTTLAPLGKDRWDYEHKSRVQIQRSGITRTRPAMKAGWKVKMQFLVTLPEYVDESFLHNLLSDAGRLIGVGDFRPTYGRFRVTSFKRD